MKYPLLQIILCSPKFIFCISFICEKHQLVPPLYMCFHCCGFLCLILSLKSHIISQMCMETGSLLEDTSCRCLSPAQSILCLPSSPFCHNQRNDKQDYSLTQKTNIWIQCIPTEQRSHFHANQLSNKN